MVTSLLIGRRLLRRDRCGKLGVGPVRNAARCGGYRHLRRAGCDRCDLRGDFQRVRILVRRAYRAVPRRLALGHHCPDSTVKQREVCVRVLAADMRPSFAKTSALRKTKGAGKAGCTLHPHNPALRIIGRAGEYPVVGSLVIVLPGRHELGLDAQRRPRGAIGPQRQRRTAIACFFCVARGMPLLGGRRKKQAQPLREGD